MTDDSDSFCYAGLFESADGSGAVSDKRSCTGRVYHVSAVCSVAWFSWLLRKRPWVSGSGHVWTLTAGPHCCVEYVPDSVENSCHR